MTKEKLREHIHGGYHTIRRGIGILGLMFPTVLLAGGLIGRFSANIKLPASLSAYYLHPMGNIYVGLLCTIGICLFLYKGFSEKEDLLLDAAGSLAFLTAIIPAALERAAGQPPYAWGWLHDTCAILFFLNIAYVCLKLAPESLDYLDSLDDESVRKKINTDSYRKTYKILGHSMWVLPAALLVRAHLLKDFHYLVLWVEISVVVAFSFYWIKKSKEMRVVDDIALKLECK